MQVVSYPDPVLMRPATPLAQVDDEVRQKVQQMQSLMLLEEGVGLAAPQVGWGVRLLLASPDGEAERVRAYINPAIVSRGGGTEWGEEGCLSFPGIYGDVLRHKEIRLKALDLRGSPFEEQAEGFLARVFQHEIDHLNGILFISKMRPVDKAQNKNRLAELVRSHEARVRGKTF